MSTISRAGNHGESEDGIQQLETQAAHGNHEELDYRPVDRANGQMICAVLVACPDDLERFVEPVINVLNQRIGLDPELVESLVLLGMQKLGRKGRVRLPGRVTDSKQVWAGLKAGLGTTPLSSTIRVALGVVIIDHDQASVETRISQIKSSPEYATLPIHLQGIGLSPGEAGAPANIVSLDLSAGPARLDNVILQSSFAIVEEAAMNSDGVVTAAHLSNFFPSIEIVASDNIGIQAVRQADDEVADETNRLLAKSQRRHTTDKYAVALDRSLRLTYIVVALGAESRPKTIRRRIIDLAVGIDQGLCSENDDSIGRTILVVAGQGKSRQRMFIQTGELVASDFDSWRSTFDYLDLTETMNQLSILIRENLASFRRRAQRCDRPLVMFILPSAALSGTRCLQYFQSIAELADIGWIVTDINASLSGYEAVEFTMVHDKEDVVNELLHAVGHGPPAEGPSPSSASESASHLHDEGIGPAAN
jgi:hypothetical protein